MKLKKMTMALPAVVMISLGMLISACGDTPAAGTTGATPDAAKQQFLADRGGTPGATSSGTPGAGGAGFNRNPGLAGTVETVDGTKITVKIMQTGAESVIQLADTAKVTKEMTGTIADLKTGDTVTAIGTKTGDSITAVSVRIGTGGFAGFGGQGAGGFGGRGANASGTPFAGNGTGGANASGTPGAGGFGGRGANASGTPRAGFGGNGGANASGTPRAGGDFATGTVQKIDGSTITIQATDGTTSTFTVTADTTVQESVDLQPSDLKAGDTIFATGTQNGDVFDATAVQVVTNLAQFPGGGQGGFGAPGGQPGQQVSGTPAP